MSRDEIYKNVVEDLLYILDAINANADSKTIDDQTKLDLIQSLLRENDVVLNNERMSVINLISMLKAGLF